MRFGLTEEQRELRDTVRDALADLCPPATVRAAWVEADADPETTPRDTVRGLWPELAALGVFGVMIPEPAGGLGMGPVELTAILEQLGHAGVPGPVVETAFVGAPLLVASGGSGQDVLSGVLTGTTLLSAAFGREEPTPPSYAAHGADADLLWLPDADHLALVPRHAARCVAQRSVDHTRGLARADWNGAGALPGRVNPAQRAAAFDRGALGTAAMLFGIGRRLSDMTVEYARVREQFGRPIGSFQAVQHHLADVAIALHFARPLLYRAAWAVSVEHPRADVAVSAAKLRCSVAAATVGRVALQVHGAIGYTTECDLHLSLKRAWSLSAAWGDDAFHRARIGEAVLTHPNPEDLWDA